MKKKIILVLGDPNSVNSEIIFKSWNKLSKSTKKRIYLIANYNLVLEQFKNIGKKNFDCSIKPAGVKLSEPGQTIVPPERVYYLAEIAETVREYHNTITHQSCIARELQQLRESARM